MPRVSAVTGPKILVPEDQLERARRALETSAPGGEGEGLADEIETGGKGKTVENLSRPVRVPRLARIIAFVILLAFLAAVSLSILAWLASLLS